MITGITSRPEDSEYTLYGINENREYVKETITLKGTTVVMSKNNYQKVLTREQWLEEQAIVLNAGVKFGDL